MSYKIETISLFDKQVKRLAKKYPSIKTDLEVLANLLSENPELGVSLGNGFYKVRMAISSKGKGKSGGARVITFVKIIAHTVYLTSIYDKGEKATLTDMELKSIFGLIP
jgi:hypothetical protein